MFNPDTAAKKGPMLQRQQKATLIEVICIPWWVCKRLTLNIFSSQAQQTCTRVNYTGPWPMSREAVASEFYSPTKNSVGPLCRRQFRGWIGIRRRRKQEAKKFAGHAASGSAKKVAPTTLRHAVEFQKGWIPLNSTMSYKKKVAQT